jgi:hypothetical protein
MGTLARECGAGTSNLRRRGALEPTSVALEPQTGTSVGRWNLPARRWNLKPAQAWRPGTHQCGAGTSNLHRREALEPYPVWSFKSIKRNGVCRWGVVCCLLGFSIVVEGRCQAVSASVGIGRRQSAPIWSAAVGATRRWST